MAIQYVNVGSAPNDGTGDPLRTAFIKINSNFGEIVVSLDAISDMQSNIVIIEGDIVDIETDITTIQGDITTIQSDITTIQGDITTIESDITTLEVDVATKTEWKGDWIQQEYILNDQVIDQGYLAIANKTTIDRPAPQPLGQPYYVYAAPTISTTSISAKQVIFGNRYQFNKDVILEGWRVNVIAGNDYSIYLVRDPLGTPVVTQVINYTAQRSGWVPLNVVTTIVKSGSTYDLVATVSEPEATSTIFTANYNYKKPTNFSTVNSGDFVQANTSINTLRISKTDANAIDRTAGLAGLVIGDIIIGDATRWAIQSATDSGTYFTFVVSPPTQITGTGLKTFTFESTAPTPITYPFNTDYWLPNPSPGITAEGLLGIDQTYFSIVPNDTAYGVDILIQEIIPSADWDIQAFSGLGGGTADGGEPSGDGVPTTREIDINGVALDLSSDRAWRTALADTGVLSGLGLSAGTPATTTINIAPTFGIVVDNESDPHIPEYTEVNYPGISNVVIPDIATTDATYVLLTPDGLGSASVTFLHDFPTSPQRKENIFLGKAGHPNGVITTIVNSPDYINSPQAFARDIFQAIGPFINENVYPSNDNANLTFVISAGNFYGAGINYVNDRSNPNKLASALQNPALFLYRTLSGAGSATPVSNVDRSNYSNPTTGAITAMPAGPNNSQVQYLWGIPGQGFVMEYGQQTYGSLDDARNAVGKEIRTTFPSLPGNAILLAALVVRNGATNLNLLADAQWYKADKLGQLSPVGGSISGGSSGYTVVTPSTGTILTQTTGEILVKCDSTAGNFILGLPTAINNTAKFHIKKMVAANTVIIDPSVGAQTIDNGTTAVMYNQYTVITLISDNINWLVI